MNDPPPHQEEIPLPKPPPQPELAEETLEGTVDRIVFESADTGFFVARLERPGRPGVATIVGNAIAISPGESVRLHGRWIEDARFGRQFQIHRYEVVLPTTVQGIAAYLGSGLIHGVGPKMAERIVQRFGLETLQVIEQSPSRLKEVEGIGPKRIARIHEAWKRQQAVQHIMVFLQGHGIGIKQAIRIYKHYGDKAVAVIRADPYRLAGDIAGVAFKTADAVARSVGIAEDDPRRIAAAVAFVLGQAGVEGHCFLPAPELLSRTSTLLGLPVETVEAAAALAAGAGIVREGEGVYLEAMQAAEASVAGALERLLTAPPPLVSIDVARAIPWIEQTTGVALAEQQREAVRQAVARKVLVITGGPGTGKTTVLKGMLAMFEKKNLLMTLAAPTGRAAKRMEDATGRTASTIHRLLAFSPRFGGFSHNADNPLETDLLVVDEASMVDVQLMAALLAALPDAARLILVGDVDQLPSVGAGNVLFDIIASTAIPVVRLETVYRQAAESGIITNAHGINRGVYPSFNDRDCFFVERRDGVAARETVIELVTRRIPQKFGLDPVRDIQVLAPMHKGDCGVAALNGALQEALNPRGRPVPRMPWRVGDKVMQTRNNYDLDVFNGDVGLVAKCEEDAGEVQIDFEDRSVVYGLDEADDLVLAYAATVHKSQGSEYPAVVVPLLPQFYVMLQRNLLYTAVTRARSLLILVGDPKALARAVKNADVARRHTRLAERIRERFAAPG